VGPALRGEQQPAYAAQYCQIQHQTSAANRGRVGVLSLGWPRYPKDKAKQVAVVTVYVGNGNIGRTFAVFEKIA
jgi:hypothetical protein